MALLFRRRPVRLTPKSRHVIVHAETGRFVAWPANGGLWAWGNEIVVGFSTGQYLPRADKHSIDKKRPIDSKQARSLDGGETWTLEETVPDSSSAGAPLCPAPGDVDFTAAGFALKCVADRFWLSVDRGHAWRGPYRLFDFESPLTARTDVIVLGPRSLLLGLSAQAPSVRAKLKDRAFVARTDDGGRSFRFQGWMTGEPLDIRSVMPATVRAADGRLVSALRRRRDYTRFRTVCQENWVDIHESLDCGRTWAFVNKVADTADGRHNGNPPSLAKLPDGRLAVAYGCRSKPYGIRARLSEDYGRTWGPELILREDGRTWDIGYPRTAVLADGRLLTIYYFTSAERPEQHIAATVWNPN